MYVLCYPLMFTCLLKVLRRRRNLCLLNGVLENDVLAGKLLVHTSESVELVLGGVALLRIKVHLEHLGSVHAVAGPLANDLGGVHEVVQQSGVDRSEGPAAGTGKGLARGARLQ